MSQLVQLRQKIKSIQTTRKITQAVRLVSMSFYNKVEKLSKPLHKYSQAVKSQFLMLLQNNHSWKNPVIHPDDIFDKRPLVIVVATSKGLCGSLNSNLFSFFEQVAHFREDQKLHLIAIGSKAITYFKEQGCELLYSYNEITSHNFITMTDDLIEKITLPRQPYSSVTVFSSSAHSVFLQRPLKSTIIPLHLDQGEKVEIDEEIIWEQPSTMVLDALAISYMRSSLMNVLFQSLRAEHAARFMAMENSTNNAEKYLERLTLQFNKMRQGLITKEISELSSSFPSR